jgi:hypothetical protein
VAAVNHEAVAGTWLSAFRSWVQPFSLEGFGSQNRKDHKANHKTKILISLMGMPLRLGAKAIDRYNENQ